LQDNPFIRIPSYSRTR